MVLIREHYYNSNNGKTKFVATFRMKKEGFTSFVNVNIKVFALDAREAERKARAEINTWKDLKTAKLLYIENTATGDIT
ncbi:MAG: hypothetical protein ACOC11_02550 [Prolixibacteraceae bacterium]